MNEGYKDLDSVATVAGRMDAAHAWQQREPTTTVPVGSSQPALSGAGPVEKPAPSAAAAMGTTTNPAVEVSTPMLHVAVSRPGPRCSCCGSKWHCVSVWLFRFALPVLMLQSLLQFIVYLIILGFLVALLAVASKEVPGDIHLAVGIIVAVMVFSGAEFGCSLGCAVSMGKEFYPCCTCRCCCNDGGRGHRYLTETREPAGATEMGEAVREDVMSRDGHVSTGTRFEIPVQQHTPMEDEERTGCLYRGTCCFVVQIVLLTVVIGLFMTLNWLNYAAWKDSDGFDFDWITGFFLALPLIKTVGWFTYFVALVLHFCSSSASRVVRARADTFDTP